MNSFQLILLYILITGGFVYFAVCLFAFSGHFRTIRSVEKYTPTVAVIIAARNEEKTIGPLLSDLSGQNYPEDKLTIVVVDDCSEDRTAEVVREFIANDSRIILRETGNTQSPYSHKKRAVYEGIINSDSEIIMTTDADCRVPRCWISGMAGHFTEGVDLVAGMVSIEGGGLFGWLEALELTGIQSMASGLMNARFPITCNGANLAYRRSAFERADGFEGIGNIVSGDDDLLMQKIAGEEPSRVVFATGTETTVRNASVRSPIEFINQRARWASKISRYPSKSATFLLTVIFAFFAAMPVWIVLAVLGDTALMPLLAVYGLKSAGDLLLTAHGVLLLRRPYLLLLFPLAELIHVPYIIIVTLKGFFGSFEWRGRCTSAVSLECGENAND